MKLFQKISSRKIGVMMVVFALVTGFATFFYMDMADDRNSRLCEKVCGDHEDYCPMDESFGQKVSYYVSSASFLMFVVIGGIIAYSKPEDMFFNDRHPIDVVRKVLNEDETQVLDAVVEQEGIKQSTLKYRVDMSKTKLSYVISDLVDRNLLVKEKDGRTNRIYLKNSF